MEVKRKITYKSARNKGKQLERDVAKALSDININAKRVPMSGALAWLKGDVAELDKTGQQNIHIHECKNHETLKLPAWWRQAAAESTKGEIPALHFRSNRRSIFTTMRCPDFDDLVFDYEQRKPELTLNLIDMPARVDFWKFYDQEIRSPMTDMFLWELLDKETGEIEELVTISFDLYLKLRKVTSVPLPETSLSQPIIQQHQPQPGTTADTGVVPSLASASSTAG